jgi:beta-phosphoglucomutase-like phosphatase (HAD superfamily)
VFEDSIPGVEAGCRAGMHYSVDAENISFQDRFFASPTSRSELQVL